MNLLKKHQGFCMNKYQISLLFICLTISNLNNCYQEKNNLFERKNGLDPKNKNLEKQISVYAVKIDDQHYGKFVEYFKRLGLEDGTCLHRAYNATHYMLEEINKDTIDFESLTTKLTDDMNQPFLNALNFDAFYNPQLFSLIMDCKKESVKKIVYFNSSHKTAPVAGKFVNSYISTPEFKYIQKLVTENINSNEVGYFLEIDCLDPSLCFNSDYKELLKNINNMKVQKNYQFGVISTKNGGMENGHGIAVVVDQKEGQVQIICMDGGNVEFSCWSGYFANFINLLNRMALNPIVLENIIVRYICATKSHMAAVDEIVELGLQDNDLYKSHYSCSSNYLYQLFNRYNLMSFFSLLIFVSVRFCGNCN